MIDQEFINILACPSCRGEVKCHEENILCEQCGLKYPVRNGVPVMLVDEATHD